MKLIGGENLKCSGSPESVTARSLSNVAFMKLVGGENIVFRFIRARCCFVAWLCEISYFAGKAG